MKRALLWIIPLTLVMGAGGGMLLMKISGGGHAPEAANTQSAEADTGKPEPGHLKLTAEQVEQSGIKTDAVKKATLTPDVRVFGVLQEDPDASFTLRAEAAGTIRTEQRWPDVGQVVDDGTVIGNLEPRIGPSDQIALAAQRVTLQGQVSSAQADVNAATISADAAKTVYERLKILNEQNKNVSDRVVEEAHSKVETEEAHLAGAKKALELTSAALEAMQAKLTPIPLALTHGGEVVEVLAHPGEATESGQPILRVARFDTVVAAVSVPSDAILATDVSEARIVPLGEEEKALTGTRMGTAELTDPKTRDRVLMFRIQMGTQKDLRPGRPVIAYLPAPGAALEGVTIPDTAIVRFQGKAWVYIADDATNFERREVTLDRPAATGDAWFIGEGLKENEQLVTTGAQVLLADEVNVIFAGGAD